MKNIFLFILLSVLAVSLLSTNIVYGITDTRYLTGSKTGTNGAQVTQMIALQGAATQLALYFSANGTYSSQSATIKASIDNTTWITVDSVSLSTGSSLGKYYSDTNKATTVPVNPTTFPFLNITLPAIAQRVQTITYSATR